MRIHVVSPADVANDQMRAYAEYRVFAELAKFGGRITGATVRLERSGAEAPVTCAIEVDLDTRERVRCQATEPRPAEAIERAARRMARRVGQPRGARIPRG